MSALFDLPAYQNAGSVTVATVNVPANHITMSHSAVATSYSLQKREEGKEDSTSTSSSHGSKTTSKKSSKCTGSSQECELPNGNKHTTAVTVGVAVAIPVAFVIILLSVILFIVYRRSKREAKEDNDPDFEGDSEYLPHDHTYQMHTQYSSSDSNQEMKEKVDHAFYDDNGNMHPPFSNSEKNAQGRFSNRYSTNQPWATNPFQLPEQTEDTDSLRNFAKQIQNDGFGGYHIASTSRSGSQISLQMDQNSFNSNSNGSNLNNVTNRNSVATKNTKNTINKDSIPMPNKQGKSLNYTESIEDFASDSETNLNTASKDIAVANREVKNDNDSFEFENNEPQEKRISFDERNINKNNTYDDEENQDNDDGYATKLALSPEEENIQRMKSIYKVYLDREETIRQNDLESDSTRNNDNNLQDHQIMSQQDTNLPQIHVEEASHFESNEGQDNALKDTPSINASHFSRRIASSIYSEAPVHAYQQQGFPYMQQPQQYGSNYDMQQNYVQNYPYMQQQQQQQMYNNYPPLPNMPTQYAHPQTLEQIDELPMPARLAPSASSHSLTSFKKPSKQQNQMQAARMNGTALNPMDHPDMFYSNNETYSPPMPNQQFEMNSSMGYGSNNSIMTNGQLGVVPSPYQLRKSVVMTNPAELQANTGYKPAGSFRNISGDVVNRANSLATQTNPYYQQQQQHIHSRVSGLLENNDMVQPPSVGGILPHSGSNEDLRKQLGSSNNYTVS